VHEDASLSPTLTCDVTLSPSSQIHGCAATASCRFFAQNLRLLGMTYALNFDKLPYSSSRMTFPLALGQALAPSWARAQRVRTLSRCALLRWLIVRLLKTSAADAFAQRKLCGFVLRRSLCQTVSEQFDFAGRTTFSASIAMTTPTSVSLEERSSVARRQIGKRTRQRE
jgi:hypothetical protein